MLFRRFAKTLRVMYSMRMAYRIYLYWKYFFEFFPENNPGVYRISYEWWEILPSATL